MEITETDIKDWVKEWCNNSFLSESGGEVSMKEFPHTITFQEEQRVPDGGGGYTKDGLIS